MAITNLSCANIGALDDGAAALVINAAINEVVADLDDRGDDGKPRRVEILIEMVKADGLTVAHVQAGAKVPKRRTGSTSGKLLLAGKQAAFSFSEHAPEDPTQHTIDEYTKE
jgi:hypothetical protein